MPRTLLVVYLLLVAVALGLFACSPLTVINALTPSSSYSFKTDIAYGSDSRQKLDIYMPVVSQGKPPVVVFFYGGSWNSGKRQDYRFVGEALASRGIMAVLADYRINPQVVYPAFIEDSAQAVSWTARHIAEYGGDTQRLYLMGHSAGAYNAAMVALDQRWLAQSGLSPAILKGWIGLAGPYDFLPIDVEEVKPSFLYPNTPLDSQPINHVSANAPSTLLIAGKTDTVVKPKRNTLRLAKALQGKGVEVEVIMYPNISHTKLVGAIARPFRSLAPVLDDVVRFVVKSDPKTNKRQ